MRILGRCMHLRRWRAVDSTASYHYTAATTFEEHTEQLGSAKANTQSQPLHDTVFKNYTLTPKTIP